VVSTGKVSDTPNDTWKVTEAFKRGGRLKVMREDPLGGLRLNWKIFKIDWQYNLEQEGLATYFRSQPWTQEACDCLKRNEERQAWQKLNELGKLEPKPRREEGRGKRKREEGRGKKDEGRGKRDEGRGDLTAVAKPLSSSMSSATTSLNSQNALYAASASPEFTSDFM
jgi:hypothetical protein